MLLRRLVKIDVQLSRVRDVLGLEQRPQSIASSDPYSRIYGFMADGVTDECAKEDRWPGPVSEQQKSGKSDARWGPVRGDLFGREGKSKADLRRNNIGDRGDCHPDRILHSRKCTISSMANHHRNHPSPF